MAAQKWMIYGTGVTGALIAKEVVRQGFDPIIAGRTAAKVERLADSLGIESVVVDLTDTPTLERAVADVDLVVHAVGPFEKTSEPMVKACIKGGTHYLDISNEISVFHLVRGYEPQARERGIALIPAVGYGVASNDGLVRYVANQVTVPTALEIVIHIASAYSSGGADQTRLAVMRSGGLVRRGGELREKRLGWGARRFDFPHGAETILAIPSGELEAAYYNTGVDDITVYSSFPVSPVLARLALPVVQKLVSVNAVYNFLKAQIDRRPGGTESKPVDMTEPQHSYLWARASNAAGESFEAWQDVGDGYDFTARSVVAAVARVLADDPCGYLTPTQAFGADFALGIEGVRRFTTIEN